jgi:[pyruvate, water dikinase]-phosphate phosphotransferase / [pyruvate, water dikinase] kinase
MKNSYAIYIISGGAGTSGEQLVHTVLAQFPDNQVEVFKITNARFESQIADVISRATVEQAAIVHTLVDAELRAYLVALAEERGVATFDLMGPLIEHLEKALDKPALSQPGLYRKLNKAYFDRVAAIEYTLAHDDGQRPETWSQAEIVLLGVSRSGKTPISLYLSVLGWKVANLPLVISVQPPGELFRLDRKKVLGLKIDAGQLMLFRRQRQRRLGVAAPSPYTDPENILQELEFASKFYQRNGFTTVEVTDKPIESAADEIIRIITG